jgi:hypothetical protein
MMASQLAYRDFEISLLVSFPSVHITIDYVDLNRKKQGRVSMTDGSRLIAFDYLYC